MGFAFVVKPNSSGDLVIASPVLLTGLFVTLLVYLVGLPGDFVFDDQTNVMNNKELKLESYQLTDWLRASFSSDSGPLGRPVSMFTFALNQSLLGEDAWAYKIVNIAIHLFCGWLVFIFIQLLLLSGQLSGVVSCKKSQAHSIASIMAVVWLVHPLHLTSVLYVVQRMTSLTAMFMLLGMIMWLWLRVRQINNISNTWRWSIPIVFLMMAALSKENGVLLIPLLMIIEWQWLGFSMPDDYEKKILKIVWSSFLVVGFMLVILAFFLFPEVLFSGYEKRDFTASQRLMTEFRVLWGYIWQMIWPLHTNMTLYHDQLTHSQGLVNPMTTLVSLLAWIAVLMIAWIKRKVFPLAFLGVLFFLVSHSMESSVLPLELVYEHRNYLPSLGILMIVMQIYLSAIRSSGVAIKNSTKFCTLLFILFCLSQTSLRAYSWSDLGRYYIDEVANQPQSPRANHNAGEVYAARFRSRPELRDNFDKAILHFEKASTLAPTFCNAYFGKIYLMSTSNMNIPNELKRDFHLCLSTGATSGSRTSLVNELFNCEAKGQCQLGTEYILSLIQALKSQASMPRVESGAMKLLALFHYRFNNSPERALKWLNMAESLQPGDLSISVNRLELLTILGSDQQARILLHKIRNKDYLNRYQKQLARIEGRLNSD